MLEAKSNHALEYPVGQHAGTERLGKVHSGDLAVIENLMAAGTMLPGQTPSPTRWTPERRLAAAVLAGALIEIRDHAHNPAYRRKIGEDIEWIQSDDAQWPFSFVRLCALFDLEHDWVREVVARWLEAPVRGRRVATSFRHAA